MSEMPPSGSDSPTPPAGSPQVPPPPEPPQVPAYATPTGPPEDKPRKKIVWWAFALGFITPAVGTALSLWILSSTPLVALSALVGWGPILAVVVAFIVGLVKPDDILRSFGVGGMVGIGVGVLITLLLFGACLGSLAGLTPPSPTGD